MNEWVQGLLVVGVPVLLVLPFSRRRGQSRREHLRRLLVLALASLGCAAAATVTAFAAGYLFLPPEDGARESFLGSLLLFGIFASVLALPAAAVGFACAAFVLRDADLRRTLPWVVGAACVGTSLASPFHWFLAPVVGTAVAISAMFLVREPAPGSARGPNPLPSVAAILAIHAAVLLAAYGGLAARSTQVRIAAVWVGLGIVGLGTVVLLFPLLRRLRGGEAVWRPGTRLLLANATLASGIAVGLVVAQSTYYLRIQNLTDASLDDVRLRGPAGDLHLGTLEPRSRRDLRLRFRDPGRLELLATNEAGRVTRTIDPHVVGMHHAVTFVDVAPKGISVERAFADS